MNSHPLAAAIAAAVAGRDGAGLAAAVTGTVRLRALLPAGPICPGWTSRSSTAGAGSSTTAA